MEYSILLTNETPKIFNRNLGLELLRGILCFWVILFHCLRVENKYLKNIIKIKIFHVPTFIFISFYFLYKNLCERNIHKIKFRFKRLLIPYFIWPIIVFIINNLFYQIFKFNRFGRFLSFNDLKIQLITGRKYINVLWFQFNLIFFTLLFFIISFLFKNNFLFILQTIGIFFYFLQYSDLNYIFFNKYKDTISRTLGYFCETAPIAITSLSFSSINIVKKLKNHRKKALFFSFLFLCFLFHYDIFLEVKGFAYRGIINNFGSFFLFITFSLLPLENIDSIRIILFINKITSYTQGIYCLHSIVNAYLKLIFNFIKNSTFLGCISIYLVSYYLSYIGIRYFGKTKLKYLFI